MDFDRILQDTISIYQSNRGSQLDESAAKHIVRSLLSVRDTEKILQNSPRHLLQIVFENPSFYGKSVYPCDIVELRNILSKNKIQTLSKVILFSNNVANRIIKDQKVKIILNQEPDKFTENHNVYGGMAVFNTNILDIKNKIHSIIIENENYESVEVVENIVKSLGQNYPVYADSSIPGIDKYKFAKSLRLFEIDLPTLGIHHEKCRSTDPIQALRDVLSVRWDRRPDKADFKRKPENFTAEFWAGSGFIESIVREIGGKKTAQSMNPQSKSLQLTEQEQQIYSTLLDINQKMGLGITFRVAGGWVRDKLLGTPSDDIDIALDKMTGQQFVEHAIQYKKANPNAPINIDSSYVVKVNPDKSKHLETTALDIAGLKIDFVNLRDESYGDSRIPTMTLSSDPKVDAQRRDLTINSMFYNVNTQQVEDYVGGLNDLQSMTLRTPMDPTKTFLDDPLRMLRVFRFFSRYPNAKIEEQTLNAMKNPQVHEAYRQKVSPERAGPEIIKMFGAERPAEAIRALFATGMDKPVFSVPETENLLPLDMNQRNKHHKFNLLEHTLRVVENLDKLMKQNKVDKKDRVNMRMAAVFHDYGKAHPEIGKPKTSDPEEYGYAGHEDKSAEIADAIMKRIGIGEDDRKFVSMVVRQHMRPHAESWSNKSIGKFMRDTQIPGSERDDIWKFVMMHAQADTMSKSEEGDQADFDLKGTHMQQMEEYRNRPVKIQMKPLVDGMQLQQMFPGLTLKPLSKGQPNYIKFIQDKLMEEQYAGNIVDAQQALQFVESIRGEVQTMYGNQQGKTANNWYERAKTLAEAPLPFGEKGRLSKEGPATEYTGIKKMIYREPGGSAAVAVGDRYRSRAVGVAFEASKDKVYTVVEKRQDHIMLEDDEGKKQKVEIGIELQAKFVKV